MARRLTRQTRDDVYGSRRDYQTIIKKAPVSFHPSESNILSFNKEAILGTHNIIAFGGYIKPDQSCRLVIKLLIDNNIESIENISLNDSWNRIGVAADSILPADCSIILEFDSPLHRVETWGFQLDGVQMPSIFDEKDINAEILNQSHIVPETYYLPHDNPSELIITEGNEIKDTTSDIIDLKKCSYCQRYLPINSMRLGSLSFHKHNSKLTNHQNECRSCKKWRINSELNKLRTTDQLNESSLITRERKIFLGDSGALFHFRLSNGEGLKSFVWKRFGKKCFKCNKELLLKEVQLDHTRPLAYLWPIDEHASCLCAVHNNEKKDKFPVEYYSEQELRSLADITGLSFEELSIKSLNPRHLSRILKDVTGFALQWEPRTFNAVARKIKEISPEIDLFSILQQENNTVYDNLTNELAKSTNTDDEEF